MQQANLATNCDILITNRWLTAEKKKEEDEKLNTMLRVWTCIVSIASRLYFKK